MPQAEETLFLAQMKHDITGKHPGLIRLFTVILKAAVRGLGRPSLPRAPVEKRPVRVANTSARVSFLTDILIYKCTYVL